MFHNSNLFGSCIVHILYTRCAKIKKNNSGAKRLSLTRVQLFCRRLESALRHEISIMLLYFYCFLPILQHTLIWIIFCPHSSFCSVLRLFTLAENECIKNKCYIIRFLCIPLHDKLRIVNKVRPTHLLHNLMNYCTTKTSYKTCCLFQYKKFDWLSGCEKKTLLLALFMFF